MFWLLFPLCIFLYLRFVLVAFCFCFVFSFVFSFAFSFAFTFTFSFTFIFYFYFYLHFCRCVLFSCLNDLFTFQLLLSLSLSLHFYFLFSPFTFAGVFFSAASMFVVLCTGGVSPSTSPAWMSSSLGNLLFSFYLKIVDKQ